MTSPISIFLFSCIAFHWASTTIIIFRPQDRPQPIYPPQRPIYLTPPPPTPAPCPTNATNCTEPTTPRMGQTPYPLPPFPAAPPVPPVPPRVKLEFIPLGQLLFGNGK